MSSRSYLPFVAPLVLAGCATTYHAGAPQGAIDVIAHRGASAYAPENTLSSFQRAMELGADWFELDCQLTKDGAVVVMHNGEVDKTTNGKGRVIDKTLAELKALDAGQWYDPKFAGERIPTLDEALDLAKDRTGVYIEVKSSDDDSKLMHAMIKETKDKTRLTPALRKRLEEMVEQSGTKNLELARKTIAAVRAHKMKDQVVIQSFSPVICFVSKMEAPELRTEFLGSDPKDEPWRWPTFVAFGTLIDVDGFNVDYEALTQERLAAFHQAGKTVAIWTVDDEALMQQYGQWGVDSIISNRPDVCLRVLKESNKRP